MRPAFDRAPEAAHDCQRRRRTDAREIGHQDRHQIRDVAALDGDPPAHIELAELEIGMQPELDKRGTVADADGHHGVAGAEGHLTATRANDRHGALTDHRIQQLTENKEPLHHGTPFQPGAGRVCNPA